MSRRILFEFSAFEDFNQWESLDKKVYRKIVSLIKDIERSPFTGLGKPEPLKYEMSGYWSRRIKVILQDMGLRCAMSMISKKDI